MVNNIFLTRLQLGEYLGVTERTAQKHYKIYLEKAKKDGDQRLTMYDIQRIDKVPIGYIQFKIYGEVKR